MNTTPPVEVLLIKLLLKYDLYKSYGRYVRISKEMRELQTLYHTLEILHDKYPDTNKTVAELKVAVESAYPQLRQAEKDAIYDLCQAVEQTEVKEEILHDVLRRLQIKTEAHALALAALDVSEGRKTPEDLSEIWDKIQGHHGDEEEFELDKYFVTSDLKVLSEHTVMDKGLRWRLDCLNQSLGPLRIGDFGFVFARPESGKTTFLADQCTYFAQQTDRPIVWFNNEEQGEKVRLRTFQAALGLRNDQLWQNIDANNKKYQELIDNRLLIYDDASIHRKDVERVIERHKPIVVVFDQIDKIKGFNADRPDLVLGRIYQWARELAKDQCIVIGICQADGTGEGVRWLTMSHVAEAKTSKQAEADWILGIGKTYDGSTEAVRYLNISKNKLMGDQDTDPNLRHGRFEVFIKPHIARYEDIS